MAFRDYLPSFLRREQDASPDLLGEPTPSERQRLNSTEKDPIEYWERAGDKTLLSADILKSMESSNSAEVASGWTRQDAEAMNAHLDAKAAREWERSEPSAESVRKAERMADATDPMHDEWRERQADMYKPKSEQAKRNADEDYWRGVMARERMDVSHAAQKAQVDERFEAKESTPSSDDAPQQKQRAVSRVMPVVVAAVATSFVWHGAQAQDIDFLRRMSQDRTNEMTPVPQHTPSGQPMQAAILPPEPHLTCMSTTSFQPVLERPAQNAPVIGYTQRQVAVKGMTADGYAQVRYYNGQLGYVPSDSVRPFASTVKPGAACTISGQRANHAPVFSIG